MKAILKRGRIMGGIVASLVLVTSALGQSSGSPQPKPASKRGLDPDQGFNNVEIVTAEKIGMEATTYVRNIYKYYVAYKLQVEAHEMARKAREQVAPGTSN